jgi:xylulokinase
MGMTEEYLLGIDIGTSACKTALFTKEGKVKAASLRDYPVYYPKPGWAEQNPDEWWEAVCDSIKKVLGSSGVRPAQIAGIGIDGQSWAAVAVDKGGEVLANTPIWMDTRAQSVCDRINEEIGADKIFGLCGNMLRPSYTTPKILWYKEHLPGIYERTYKILQSNSFIAYRLTGKTSQDISQGYGLHCFNMRTGQWDEKMCKAMGIPVSFLPKIVPCHQIIGTVTKEAAGQTGLAEGTPVAAGGLDAACGTLGAGVVQTGETQEQGGQAGGMSICIEEYASDPRLILGFHVVPGKWLLQGGTTGGGGVMRWLEREFGDYERSVSAQKGRTALEQYNEEAGQIPPGSDGLVFLPYMAGERSPIWDANAKGVFFGLDFGKTKGHMIRSCMEGVAYALKHNLDIAESAGAPVRELLAVGGSANSALWMQIKSDITGKPLAVPFSDMATTLGAALLAGVGIGMYDSFEDAAAQTVQITRRYEPCAENKQIYQKNYDTYISLYEDLKELMKGTGNL